MTSQAIRDSLADRLIPPENSAPIVIDYKQNQFGTARSMDPDLLRENIGKLERGGQVLWQTPSAGGPIRGTHPACGLALPQRRAVTPVLRVSSPWQPRS
jgi:hypothetical protein